MSLLVTLAVAGILAAIAYASYSKMVLGSRRNDATAALDQDAQTLEQCHSEYNSYENAACTAIATTSPSGLYSISVSYTVDGTGAATAYTLTAKPVASGPQAADTTCAKFTLNNAGQEQAFDSSGTDQSATCW